MAAHADDWRERALAAEAERDRLRRRVAELESELDLLATANADMRGGIIDGGGGGASILCPDVEGLRIQERVAQVAPKPTLVVDAACEGSNCVAIALQSPTRFAVSGANGRVYTYDASRLASKAETSSPAIALRWSPHQRLAATTMDGSLYLMDENLNILSRHKDHERMAVCCDWSPNGRHLATSSRDGSVVIYVDGVKKHCFVLPNSPECVRFVDDETLVAACASECFARYVDLPSLQESRVSLNASAWDTHSSFDVIDMAVATDARYLAVATNKDRHVVYRARENAHVRVLTGHGSDDYANTRLAWLGAANESLVSSSSAADNALLQWDFGSGKVVAKHAHAHGQPVRNLHALPAEGVVATASFDKAAKLWRTEEGGEP